MTNKELAPNGPFLYDLVDVSRQALVNLFNDLYSMLNYEITHYIQTVHLQQK